jgi:hypothetical protein
VRRNKGADESNSSGGQPRPRHRVPSRVHRSASTRRRHATSRRKFTAVLSTIALIASVTSVYVVAQISTAPAAKAAQTICTVDAGYGQCAEFTYSGADQTFTLPAGAIASNVLVKAWGAGGGGDNYYIQNGGGGGYTQGVLDLTGNTTITAIVGQGGYSACNKLNAVSGSLTGTYGGGGPSQNDSAATGGYFCGGAGGGRSAVRVGTGVTNTSASNEVLTAGGWCGRYGERRRSQWHPYRRRGRSIPDPDGRDPVPGRHRGLWPEPVPVR